MDKLKYLGGWRENKTHCYQTYHKMSNEEINKVLEDESFRLCESKFSYSKN